MGLVHLTNECCLCYHSLPVCSKKGLYAVGLVKDSNISIEEGYNCISLGMYYLAKGKYLTRYEFPLCMLAEEEK